MTQISLPSGLVIDFEDASQEDIEESLDIIRKEQPELFQEKQVSEREYIQSLNLEQAIEYGSRTPSKKEPEFIPTHEGEVESLGFHYWYGQADTDRERALRLTRRFGEGTFSQDENGKFYLLLDKIAPEIKEELNLRDTGTMYVNRPGGDFLGLMDLSDVSGFVGAYKGPLVGTMAASFALTGVGLPLSILGMGLGAAGGKMYDEFIDERFQKLQLQDDAEIWGQVAIEGLFGAFGELIVGGGLRLAKKLIKGRGRPDPERITALMRQGVPEKASREIATQQSRTQIRGDIRAGAQPTMYEATGKSIAGRLQAIHEGIFPNKAVARANSDYVGKLWSAYLKGDLAEPAFKSAMQDNAEMVTRLIKNAMKDPDEAVRLADQQLRKTIQGEMDLLLDTFVTGSRQSKDWQRAMSQNVRLWQAASSEMYKNAEDLLGKHKALFDRKVIQEEANAILGFDSAGKELRPGSAALAELSGLQDAPLFRYILSKTEDFSLTELNALRHVLNTQAKHPDLVGTTTDKQIEMLKKSIDEMFEDKAKALASQIQKGTDDPLIQAQREGIESLHKANNHYSEGAALFKSGSANMINKNINDGYMEDLVTVVRLIVQDHQPNLLKRHLDSVTPTASQIRKIESVSVDEWKAAAAAARENNGSGDIRLLNEILERNGIPPNVVQRPAPFINDLPLNDVFRRRLMGDVAKTLDQYADDAVALADPALRRDVNRGMIANAWLKDAYDTSIRGRVFDPGQFGQKFDSLGREVQDLLFGAKEAVRLRSSLKDFYLVGNNADQFSRQVLDDVFNPSIRATVEGLQNDLQIAGRQSKDALFKAIRSGMVEDADELILAAIKNPRMVDSLRQIVGDEVFEVPGGIKDMAMQRIMLQAFPEGVTADNVASGSFGLAMKSTIKKMNAQGGLSKILGQDVVEDLLRVARTAERVGDLSLKGKGGLAPAGYAAGFGMALIVEPVAALSSAGGIMFLSRLMRNKVFLNWMTKPQIRARDARLGERIIANEIQEAARLEGRVVTRSQALKQAKNEMGDLNLSIMQLKEALWREARATGVSLPAARAQETVGETVEEVVEPRGRQLPTAQPPQGIPVPGAQPPQVNPLRQLEIDKMMGVR
jgi:hypothetical protein